MELSTNCEGWLPIAEASRYLNVSVSFLCKQVRYQRIPFARPGGKSSDTGPASDIVPKRKF